MKSRTKNPRVGLFFAGLFWLCLFYILFLFYRFGFVTGLENRTMVYFIAATIMAFIGAVQQTISTIKGFREESESVEE